LTTLVSAYLEKHCVKIKSWSRDRDHAPIKGDLSSSLHECKICLV